MEKESHDCGIIRPAKGKMDPELGPAALMVMLPNELKRLVTESGAKEVAFSDRPLYRLFQAEGSGAAPAIALAGPFFGAPHAVLGLEKLIALGAKTIWVLGWCGSLQPDLTIGDIVIPNWAFSEEGTSNHYPLDGKKAVADPGLNRILAAAVARAGRKSTEGGIWTTDAIYRETPEKVSRYRQQKALAVEMEMSALLTVAAYRSAALAGLLLVSDELFDLKWKPGFSNPRLKENTRLAGDLLLDLSRSLAGCHCAESNSMLTGSRQ